METRITNLESRMDQLEARLVASARRARLATAIALIAVVGAGTWTASPQARAQIGVTLASLNNRVSAVEAKTAPITVVGTDFKITGKNVYIQDGYGRTAPSSSGLGNLIVGYNILGEINGGAHNLILGDYHCPRSSGGMRGGLGDSSGNNFIDYSISFGGILYYP